MKKISQIELNCLDPLIGKNLEFYVIMVQNDGKWLPLKIQTGILIFSLHSLLFSSNLSKYLES